MPGLVIPVVIWGRRAPIHCISSILMTPSQSHVVTGCKDGSLCVWEVTNTDHLQVQPRMMLLGHSSAVTCLAMANASSNTLNIVSSTDNGEMFLWDLMDGKCIESAKMSVVHTSVQAYQLSQCRDVRLVCSGYYPGIRVIHPNRLEILFSLCAKIHPADWISAFCMQRPAKKESDVVVAVTVSGMVKVWTIPGSVSKPGPHIFEDKSKPVRCLNAQALRCCGYNQRMVLIVCSKHWQIYDVGDFALLCSESGPRSERWKGGEFIGIDRVLVWSNEGRGYLYRLSTSVNADKENNRHLTDPSSPRQMDSHLYSIMDISNNEKSLEFSPAMLCVLRRRSRESKFLLRGDSCGQLTVWQIPDFSDKKTRSVRQESFVSLPVTKPKCSTSLSEEWKRIDPKPKGLIDQLNKTVMGMLEVTATVHLRSRNQLACGRNDGSIVLVPASLAIILQLLDSGGQGKDVLSYQVLCGHTERVNCLLYPHDENTRYDPSHLVSGGVDFNVCLWDIFAATKLHTFCVHGGEITRLLVPPDYCNAKVLLSVCVIASDHSLSLLSLKECRCVLFASRHHFPIQTVRWRPLDDFLVIGCSDGKVYVWEMETGNLDRIVQGPAADDILDACEERQNIIGERFPGPVMNIAQVLKRRGPPSASRNSAHLQNKKAEDAMERKSASTSHPSLIQGPRASPMMIQGLRTNANDPESHVIFFDTEALIHQLLREEYVALSPNSSENLQFYTAASEEPGSPDTQKKVVDFISKVRDRADSILSKKLQSKVDFPGIKSSPLLSRLEVETVSSNGTGTLQRPIQSPPPLPLSPNRIPAQCHSTGVALVPAQILMSCLHAWGIDAEVDHLCLTKLGLMRPRHPPMSFGLISTGGQMSLLLPGWCRRPRTATKQTTTPTAATTDHWQISSSVTTQHLLAVVSVANTLMSSSNATFIKSRQAKPISPRVDDGAAELNSAVQSQNKSGWSRVAALHCVLLPQLVGKMPFKPPQLDLLARRWQDQCIEIREAAQALLLAELHRMGPEGRRRVVEQWGPYLPSHINPSMTLIAGHSPPTATEAPGNIDDDDDDEVFRATKTRSFSTALSRRTRRRSKTIKHEK